MAVSMSRKLDRLASSLVRIAFFRAADGGLTLRHETLVKVMERMRSSVVIPMHWFGGMTLQAFLDDMAASGFAVQRTGQSDLTLNRDLLPSQPTVFVLEPRFLSE